MNEDSSDTHDGRRMSSSFNNQGGFFVGSPNSFNMSKWFGDSKILNMIKNKPGQQPESPQPVEDFNNVFYPRRARTQSVSSDISVDEQPTTGERRSSFSERYFALQMQQQPKANEKFASFRTAVTSYYD